LKLELAIGQGLRHLGQETANFQDRLTYRDNARYFQKVIAETNGLSKAADLLERAFGLANEDQQLFAQ